MHRIHFVALLLLPFATPAVAHEVTMNDGTVYEGKVLSKDDNEVIIETTFHGKKVLPRADVKSINTSVPPLMDQLKFRANEAKDVKARWDLYKWAKKKGFKKELRFILEGIVDLKPNDKRAHKLLGHVKHDGKWMTPEEVEAYEKQKFEEAQRAKGLVQYKGEWVTQEEKDAREKGLKKDGDEWVTEEEYHRRRGEQKINGKWVKVGFKEGKELAGKAARESRVNLKYEWSAHFDAMSEVSPELTKRILTAAEKAYGVMRKALQPQGDDYPENIEERIKLCIFTKVPGYARFAKWFDKTYKVDELVPGWARAIQRQHSWWWVQDLRATGCYQFPNTNKTFVSNVLHNVGLIMITRYKANYTEPSVWLREGFSYYVELQALGYSQSFTLGRGGGTGAGAAGTKGAVWMDSGKWRGELKKLVAAGQDPPLRRIARMSMDQFRYVELVKAWSVVEFLIRWDRKKFKQFVDISKDRSKKEEEGLRTAYKGGYRDIDKKWRAYVSNGFKL